MSKVSRRTLVLIVTLSSIGLQARGATTDFAADNNITVSSVIGSGITADLTIKTGSRAETITFNEGAFSVTNPEQSSFSVASSNSSVKSLRIRDVTNTDVVCVNNSSPGSSVVTPPSSSGVFTIVPSSSQCSSGATSGGGGGSGRQVVKTPLLVTPPTPIVPTPFITGAPGSSPVVFTSQLASGLRGEMVRRLQQFLNGQGFTVAAIGPGSPGQETDYFGPATRVAVLKFQLSNGIVGSDGAPGAGRVGPLTMARINALLGAATASSPAAGAEALRAQIASLAAQLAALQARLQQMQSQNP